jgi:ATP-dependent RNA helicase DDX5/DBP2
MPRLLEDSGLEKPWVAVYDEKSDKKYYWNRNSNFTTFERPIAVNSIESSNYLKCEKCMDSCKTINLKGYETENWSNAYDSKPVFKKELTNINYDSEDAHQFRIRNEIRVLGHNVPDPFQRFDDAQFSSDIMTEIKNAGFTSPTAIQAQAWSIAMSGRDLVAIAKTGSGKTCGFILPGIMHIKAARKNPDLGPIVLVLAPTRELAVQIKSEADKLGHTSGIHNACLYGGQPKGLQRRELQRGVQIVIATPGRLNDFLTANEIHLNQVSFLVLDEADRMLDMGFEPQIRQVISHIPQRRQTLFFSATWPVEVRSVAERIVNDQTIQVFIGPAEDRLVANKAITQYVIFIKDLDKKNKLKDIISKDIPSGVRLIIFCSTKRKCDDLALMMPREYRASAIHGDKSQPERDYVLRSFRDGTRPIMIATDLAARGIDVKEVYGVINYDFPSSGCEDYIHRIGRTGRAGACGFAWSFFTQADAKHARELIKVLEEASQKVPLELRELSTTTKTSVSILRKNKYGSDFNNWRHKNIKRRSRSL